jgi:DNA uptake protein ComE-like DNA-binding protein
MTRLSTGFTIVLLLGALASAQGQQLPILNPNVATEPELLALPQLSPALAKALIAHRPYKTMLEVNAQLSAALSKEQLSQLYVRLFLPIGLNTATRDEILLVPGVGPRMAHEFEEYRPYTSIEQFRKEIGKYVSREEVARLERYVALR